MYWEDVSQMWGMATLEPVAPGEGIINFGSTTRTNLMIYVWLLLLRIHTQKNDEMAAQLDCQHRCLLRLRRIMCFKHQQHIYIPKEPMRAIIIWHLRAVNEEQLCLREVSYPRNILGTRNAWQGYHDKQLPGPPSPSGTHCQQLGGCSWQWSTRSSRRGRCCWSPLAPAWPERRWRRWRRRSLLWSPRQSWSPWDVFEISGVLTI